MIFIYSHKYTINNFNVLSIDIPSDSLHIQPQTSRFIFPTDSLSTEKISIFQFPRSYFINSRHLGDKYLGREVVCEPISEESPGGTAPPSPGALVPTLETAIFYYNANIWFVQNFESFIIIIKHYSAGSRSAAAATRARAWNFYEGFLEPWSFSIPQNSLFGLPIARCQPSFRILSYYWADVSNLL